MPKGTPKRAKTKTQSFYDRIADVHNLALKVNGYRTSVAKYLRSLDLNLERIPPRAASTGHAPEPRQPREKTVARPPETPRVAEMPAAPEPAVAKPRPVEPAAAKPIDADEAVDPGGGAQLKRPIEPNDPYGGEP